MAADVVTLVDDPTNPDAYTATDVDGEGLAARRNVLIEGGRLERFVHNSYSARRAGTVSTGNAVRGGFAGTSVRIDSEPRSNSGSGPRGRTLAAPPRVTGAVPTPSTVRAAS